MCKCTKKVLEEDAPNVTAVNSEEGGMKYIGPCPFGSICFYVIWFFFKLIYLQISLKTVFFKFQNDSHAYVGLGSSAKPPYQVTYSLTMLVKSLSCNPGYQVLPAGAASLKVEKQGDGSLTEVLFFKAHAMSTIGSPYSAVYADVGTYVCMHPLVCVLLLRW